MFRKKSGEITEIDMENVEYAVGVDVGGSHVCSAVVNVVSGEMAGEPCTTPVDSSAGAAVILDALTENVREAISSAGLEHVENVGFAFPDCLTMFAGYPLSKGWVSSTGYSDLMWLHPCAAVCPGTV